MSCFDICRIYNYIRLMGILGTLWKGFKTITRTSFYVGSMYTFLAYFYVEEIKYRLKDTEETKRINEQHFKKEFSNYGSQSELDPLAIHFGLAIGRVYTFYSRAWNFRQYQQLCSKFHKNVIKSVIKNYDSYDIFKHKQEMEKQIHTNNLNPLILSKIEEVRDVNQQVAEAVAAQFVEIVDKQVMLQTGTILGLTEEEQNKINLIYQYREKGLYLSSGNHDKYWQYKMVQSEIKRHNFNQAIFQLMYI